MDEYLNESPSDFVNSGNQYNTQTNSSSEPTPKFNVSVVGGGAPSNGGNNSGATSTNDFSLNLDYADPNAVNQYSNTNSLNYNNSNANNNMGFTNNNFSSITGGNGIYTSPSQFNGNANSNNFLSDPNLSSNDLLPSSTANSYTNEPFDDLDNLIFPQMNTQASIGQAFDVQSPSLQSQLQPSFGQQGPQQQNQQTPQLQQQLQQQQASQIQQQYSNAPNLNEIVSPQNNASAGNNNSFLTPRYFSPPSNRGGNYNSLNSIAEDDAYNDNVFGSSSNRQDQYGSSFKSIPDIQSGIYLSPQTSAQFISPNAYDSFDTLRSPSQSYLNSPPQQQNIRVLPNGNMSSSIPNNHHSHLAKREDQSGNLLSPPSTANMSSSVPSGGSLNRDIVPTKQLSKEEKLKRRREFHNAVERRRRDLIKERIKELGSIVPPSLLNPQLSAVQMLSKNPNASDVSDLISSIKVKETKPNKSTILNKAVDYINHLRYVLQEQDKAREVLNRKIQAVQNEISGVGNNSGGFTNNNERDSNSNFNPPPAPTSSTSSNTFPSFRDTPTSYDQFGNGAATTSSENNLFNPDEFFSDIIKTSNTNLDGLNQSSDFF